MTITSSVPYSPAALNELISTLSRVQQLATSLKTGFEDVLQQTAAVKINTGPETISNVAQGNPVRQATMATISATSNNQDALLDSLRNVSQTITSQSTVGQTSATSLAPTTSNQSISSMDPLNDLSAMLAELQAATMRTTSSNQQSGQTGFTVGLSQTSLTPVNRDAVAVAKADLGVKVSSSLTVYSEDPTSQVWKMKNINDPVLRNQIDTLPLSRGSLLQVLSSPDPYAAVGDIYKSMGTYATAAPYGDKGGISIVINDFHGNQLKNVTWAPSTNYDNPWSGKDGLNLSKTMAMYGIEMPDETDWASLQSISDNLPGKPVSGTYIESPWTELMKYGFRTDPLTGEVVGGGGTAGIDHYLKTGEKRLLGSA